MKNGKDDGYIQWAQHRKFTQGHTVLLYHHIQVTLAMWTPCLDQVKVLLLESHSQSPKTCKILLRNTHPPRDRLHPLQEACHYLHPPCAPSSWLLVAQLNVKCVLTSSMPSYGLLFMPGSLFSNSKIAFPAGCLVTGCLWEAARSGRGANGLLVSFP